jgi:DNA invertase Pin-like site-specific DNA recombinase
MKVAYLRVSTKDQNLDGQRDEVTKAGAEKIFADVASG